MAKLSDIYTRGEVAQTTSPIVNTSGSSKLYDTYSRNGSAPTHQNVALNNATPVQSGTSIENRGYGSTVKSGKTYNLSDGTTVWKSDIDKWLDPTYKMTKDEQKIAKQFSKDYRATTNADNPNNANSVRHYLESLSDEDRNTAMMADKLGAKASNISAFAGGFLNAVPFATDIVDKAEKKLGYGDEYTTSNYVANQQKQSPLATTGGAFYSKALQYSALKQLPFMQKISGGISSKLGGQELTKEAIAELASKGATKDLLKILGANAVGNITADTLADVALDTTPELVKNIQSGKTGGEVAKDALKNVGANVFFNVLGEGAEDISPLIKVSKGAKALKNANNVAETVAKTVDDANPKTLEEAIANTKSNNGPLVVGKTGVDDTSIKSTLTENTPQESVNLNKVMAEDTGISKGKKKPIISEADDGSVSAEFNVDDILSGEYTDEDLFDIPASEIRKSNVFTNTLSKNGLADMKKKSDVMAAKYKVLHDIDVTKEARDTIEREGADKIVNDFFDGVREVNDGKDVDMVMMLLNEKNDLLKATTDETERQLIEAQMNEMRRSLRRFGTREGQNIEAFKKWTGTAEGAIAQGDSILAKKTKAWGKKNVLDTKKADYVAKKIDDVAKQKSNGKLDSVLRDMGNKTYAQQHEETVNSIVASFEKEFGSINGKMTDNDVEYIAQMLENNVPKWQIIDELEQRFKGNGWYTIDESLPKEKQPIYQKLNSLLSSMGKKTTPKATEELDHYGLMGRIRNTLKQNDSASVFKDFTDDDYDQIAKFYEDGMPRDIIRDEIEHKLKHGTWYDYAESAKENLPESSKLKSILAKWGNDTKISKVKEVKTHAENLEEVKNTIQNSELASFADNWKESDYETIATFLDEKVPNDVILDELEHRFKFGQFYSLDESLPEKKVIDQQIKNAINKIGALEKPQKVTEELSRNEIRKRIANTLESEYANVNFTDADIDYLTTLKIAGASSSELSDALKTRLATGTWGIDADTTQRVTDLFKQAELYNVNSKERAELELEAFATIANAIYKTPGTFFEKFDEWRYLAMLGNPKTHVRNIVSNAVFAGETSVSNSIATVIESAVDKISRRRGKGGIERTKAFINPASEADNALLKASMRDANESSYKQLSGFKNTNKDIRREIEQQRSVFRTKGMNKAVKGNSSLLETEDAIFTHTKYTTSLTGYLKANGQNASIFDAERRFNQLKGKLLTPQEKVEYDSLKAQIDLLNRGREYAIKQAQYATFHEDNKYAAAISRFVRTSRDADASTGHKIAGKIVEGVMPFTKTPFNVLRSGVEYSPLNLFNNVRDGIRMVKNGTVSATDFIEGLSKTLTGTGVFLTGYLLAKKGMVVGGKEEDYAFNNNRGLQNYSLKIDGKTYTIDQFAPFCMAFLVGAQAEKNNEKRGVADEGFDLITSDGFNWDKLGDSFNTFLNTALGIADPIFETSMMSGVNDAISTLQNGTGNALVDLATNSLTGYVTQAIPTVSGQIARTFDDTRRSTYTKNTGAAGQIEKQITKAINKIPGLSKTNEAYVDLWGREQKNSEASTGIGRFIDQTLNPTYVNTVSKDSVDNEIARLYSATNDKNVLPKYFNKEVGDNRLTSKQYHDYSVATGTARHDGLTALFKSDLYRKANNDEKAKLVQSVYSLANTIGKHTIDGKGKEDTSKVYQVYISDGMKGVITYWEISNAPDLDGDGKVLKDEKLDYLAKHFNSADYQKWYDILYPKKQ